MMTEAKIYISCLDFAPGHCCDFGRHSSDYDHLGILNYSNSE
jgi:hypothetical protein